MAIKDRLIQFVLRGKDELSQPASKSSKALQELTAKTEELNKAFDQAKDARGLAAQLGQTERDLQRAERTVERTQASVQSLRDALDKNPGSAGLQTSLKEAQREANRAARELDRLRATHAEQESAAKAAGIDTANLAREEKRLATEVDRTQAEMREHNGRLRELQREEARAARGAAEHQSRVEALRGSMSRGARQVLAFAAAYVSLNAAANLIGRGLRTVRDGIYAMLSTGDEFEGLQTRFTSLMGSVEAGQQATDWIKQFAKDTPLQLQEVSEAFALMRSYGLGPMDGSMQAITDKAEQLGGGMESLTGISTALGQAWAKQKLQTEEILQLVERGVPVWELLANVTGKNAAQLQDLATKGRLGRDVIRALIDEMGKSAKGAAAANMSRLSGLVSNLQDTWTNFLDRIAKSGALEFAKGKLQELADTIDEMDRDGRLDALAQSLSDAFIQGSKRVEEFGARLLEVDFSQLVDQSTNWLRNFGSSIDKTARAVSLAIAPIRTAINLLTAGISTLGVMSSAVFGTTLTLASKLAKLIPNIFGGEKVVSGLEKARDAAFSLTRMLARQIGQDAADIANSWSAVAGSVEDSAERQVSAFTDSARRSTQVLKQSADEIGEHFRQRIASIENAMAAISFAETQQQLAQVEKGLIDARREERLSAEEFTRAMEALSLRKAFVQPATAAAAAADQMKASIAALRAEQALAEAQYRKEEISLEQWQQRHNAAAAEILRLGTATRDTTGRLAELRAEQQQAEAEYRKGSITLEQWQQRHNAAAVGIQRLGAATSEAEGRVAGLRAEQERAEAEYRKGSITLEQWQQRHNAAAVEIRELGKATNDAATSAVDLDDALSDLASVQSAISSAQTDVDINKIRTALRKLYGDGTITARQYNEELTKLTAQQQKLKASQDNATKGQQDQNKAMEDAIVTSEALRRASGQRMEEERRAGDAAMQQRRKESSDAQQDMSAAEEFFSGVMSRAREPLAAMSQEALAAFDALNKISTANVQLDTSSLGATRTSLQQATAALREMQAAAAQSVNMTSLGKWMVQTQLQSQKLQVEFLGQKAQLQSLMQGYENGTTNLRDFVRAASGARNNLGLLNDSDLRQLESAIQAAKDRMQQLQESSASTLQSLREELMGLRGETDALERSQFRSRMNDLQAQLAEANKNGDAQSMANITRAMSTLREIQAETEQQRQAEEQKQRVEGEQAEAGAASADATPSARQQSTPAPAKVIRLETKGGQALDVGLSNDSDETKLLSILEEAGMRAI